MTDSQKPGKKSFPRAAERIIFSLHGEHSMKKGKGTRQEKPACAFRVGRGGGPAYQTELKISPKKTHLQNKEDEMITKEKDLGQALFPTKV